MSVPVICQHRLVGVLLVALALVLPGPRVAFAASPSEGDAEGEWEDEQAGEDEDEIIDPEEVVPPKGKGRANRGDLDRHLDDLAESVDSLCVIREEDDVSRIFFIPYATHEMWRPCHGQERLALSYKQFYQLTDRPDLLSAHRKIKARNTMLFLGQVVSIIGGTVLIVVGAVEKDGVPLGLGVGLAFGVTSLLSIVAGSLRPLPIGTAEAEGLALEFNRIRDPRMGRDPFGYVPRSPAMHLPVLTLRY